MADTAEQLMDLAEAHIRNAGYSSFSFRDLAAEAHIKSSSVHHHFPTKSQLAAAVVHRYTERILGAVAEAAPGRGPRAVSTYVSLFRATLHQNGGGMCLAGALSAETGGLPAEVQEAARDFFHRVIGDLAGRIGGPHAHDNALRIVARLEGAMIVARTLQDLEVFDRSTSDLR